MLLLYAIVAIAYGVIIALALAFAFAFGASAHDFDCKGHKIPEETKSGCCGVADAHLITPAEVLAGAARQDDKNNWHVIQEGEEHVFAEAEVGPSRDGCYWVWWKRYETSCSSYYSPGMGEVTPKCTDADRAKKMPISFYCLQVPMGL